MPFKFTNYSRKIGETANRPWFLWRVFMDEPEPKLNAVKSVEYRLHTTFPDPIRIVDDRATKFALEASGWGEFTIYIIIHLTNGTEEHSKYDLKLGDFWPQAEQPSSALKVETGAVVSVNVDALRIRAKPGLTSPVVFTSVPDRLFKAISGPVTQDGYSWWLLQDLVDPMTTGWAAEQYLTVQQNPDAP